MLRSSVSMALRAATSVGAWRPVSTTAAPLAAAAQKSSDPIQQLFVDKVREYETKKKRAGGKLVDADATTEDNLKKELEKVAKQYGGSAGTDMTKFPDIKFPEPKLMENP